MGRPTIRWAGNEGGLAGDPNYYVVDSTAVSTFTDERALLRDGAIGYLPPECDVAVRANWFWQDDDLHTLKSLEHLLAIYYRSIGRGANLLLNVPPDREGLICAADRTRLLELGAALDKRFSGGAQALFRRLSVFVGGCTMTAAEAVCNVGDDLPIGILDGMAALVDTSLLQREAGVGDEPRFVMLETVREYARERLDERGEQSTLQRHAEYYLALAERGRDEGQGDREVTLFDHFEHELDNLRAALEWSHAAERAADIEVRMATVLAQFWVVRGYASEGWERLKAALVRRSQVSPAVRARSAVSCCLRCIWAAISSRWASFLKKVWR